MDSSHDIAVVFATDARKLAAQLLSGIRSAADGYGGQPPAPGVRAAAVAAELLRGNIDG